MKNERPPRSASTEEEGDRVYHKVQPTTSTPIHRHYPLSLLEALCNGTHPLVIRLSRAKLVRTTMNNRRTALIVLLLRHPQILESRQRRQNRSTDPHRVLALRRRDNLDLHARGRQARQLLLHAVRNTRVHRSTAREHDVAVQITTDIEVALVDRVVPENGSAPNPEPPEQ